MGSDSELSDITPPDRDQKEKEVKRRLGQLDKNVAKNILQEGSIHDQGTNAGLALQQCMFPTCSVALVRL